MLVDEKKNSRIDSFDILRILFVLMVCYIHSVNTYSSIALTFMRVAVPGFFVITGYFLIDSLRKNKLNGQLFKTLRLFFTGWLLYLIWEGAKAVHHGTVLEFGTIFFVWWLFVLAIRFPSTSRLQFIAMIGQNYMAGMYIIHI